jgi:hypothetical protein
MADSQGHCDCCEFGDYLDWLKDDIRAQVLDAGKEHAEPWDVWKKLILDQDSLKPRGVCRRHPFKSCRLLEDDLGNLFCVAGSMCCDYSRMNRSRKGKNGPNAKLFLIWVMTSVERERLCA